MACSGAFHAGDVPARFPATAERYRWVVFRFFPPRASTGAGEVDALYTFLLVVGIGDDGADLLFRLLLRHQVPPQERPDDRPKPIHGSIPLEIAWSVIPFLVMLVMFAWGTKLYFENYTPPRKNTLDIYVTGKQWMWKIQYPGGQREINELHVPIGPAGEADAGERRRDSQLLYSRRFASEARRGARQLPDLLVSRRPSRAAITSSAPNTAAPTTPRWAAG